MDGNERGGRCGHLPPRQTHRNNAMREGPKAQKIRATTSLAAGWGIITKIVCQGLMKAVLTLWAERPWESCRQRALGRPVIAPRAGRKRFLPASQIWWLPKPGTNSLGPGRWFRVLVLQKNSLPRGSSAAGAGPSWVGGTRAMPSGEIWGGNGPDLFPPIGLIGYTQCQQWGAPLPNPLLGAAERAYEPRTRGGLSPRPPAAGTEEGQRSQPRCRSGSPGHRPPNPGPISPNRGVRRGPQRLGGSVTLRSKTANPQ
jgi:hypothetical protein